MKHFFVNNYMYSILCAQFFIVHHNLTNKNENCKKGNFLHLCNTVLLQYFLVKKKFSNNSFQKTTYPFFFPSCRCYGRILCVGRFLQFAQLEGDVRDGHVPEGEDVLH